MSIAKSYPLLSGEALTWWLLGAGVFVFILVFVVYEVLNHERTKTAAAPYAFHMVRIPKYSPSTTDHKPVSAPKISTQAHTKRVAPSHSSSRFVHPASLSRPATETAPPKILPQSQFSILSSRQRARLISRYVTYWIEHVEEKASGQLQEQGTGKIKVRVTVVSSGHLAGLALLHSTLPGTESSRAVELIRAASPYAPFPENLAKEANKLIISCTMRFMEKGNQSATSGSRLDSKDMATHKANLGESLSQALLGGDS